MNLGKTLFAQLMEFVPWTRFARIVARYGGDSRVRSLACTEQFRAMAFAQLTYRESLRDIETCLLANQTKLYSMGFRTPVGRSTLADANEGRDWRIWADLAALPIRRARKLYCNDILQRSVWQVAFFNGLVRQGGAGGFLISRSAPYLGFLAQAVGDKLRRVERLGRLENPQHG